MSRKIGKVKMAKCILNNKDKKILEVLKEYPEGIRQRNIEKLTELKGRTCYNHLEKLKDMKVLDNFFPIWKIRQSSDGQEILAKLQKKNNTEGHKICWILPLVKKPFWWDKRKDRLMRLQGWVYKNEITANNNVYHQIENDIMEIQTFKNSIYFICKENYYEGTDLEIFEKSKNDVLNAEKYLEERFRFKFLEENEFHLTLIDSHYVTLNESLADIYYKEGKTFLIETKEGYKLYIDLSNPRGLEGNNVESKRRYLEVVKDYADNPTIPNPSIVWQYTARNIEEVNKLMSSISKLPDILDEQGRQLKLYEQQNRSHLKLIQGYRKEHKYEMKKLVKKIEETKKKEQTKLSKFF